MYVSKHVSHVFCFQIRAQKRNRNTQNGPETFGNIWRNISVSSLFLNQHFGIWEDGSHGQGHDALEHAWAVFTSWEDTRDDPSHNHDVTFAHSCTHIRPEHRPHRPASSCRGRRRAAALRAAENAAARQFFGVQELPGPPFLGCKSTEPPQAGETSEKG